MATTTIMTVMTSVTNDYDDEDEDDGEDENAKDHRHYHLGIDDTDLSTSPFSPTSSLFSRTPP